MKNNNKLSAKALYSFGLSIATFFLSVVMGISWNLIKTTLGDGNSMIFAILSFILLLVGYIFSIVLALKGLKEIKSSDGSLKGSCYAWAAIIISGIQLLWSSFI